jgi:hypothetical protein
MDCSKNKEKDMDNEKLITFTESSEGKVYTEESCFGFMV